MMTESEAVKEAAEANGRTLSCSTTAFSVADILDPRKFTGSKLTSGADVRQTLGELLPSCNPWDRHLPRHHNIDRLHRGIVVSASDDGNYKVAWE